MTRVALNITGLTSAPDERARIAVQAVVGATGALDLKGEMAPTATPFYLDVQGELREFALPRTNPYFRQVFDYFVKRGYFSNTIHYRIVGSELTAENHVKIQHLGVEKDTSPVESDKKIGVPLGLIVAMVTDRRGDIEFSLPVSGNLKEPGFSLGSAIWAALKNVLTNVVTAPFQAIGKLFSKGDEVEEFKVDPVTFTPGSATVSAESSQHLQRVADFLRRLAQLRPGAAPRGERRRPRQPEDRRGHGQHPARPARGKARRLQRRRRQALRARPSPASPCPTRPRRSSSACASRRRSRRPPPASWPRGAWRPPAHALVQTRASRAAA